jgi:hypothetical protein
MVKTKKPNTMKTTRTLNLIAAALVFALSVVADT